MAAAAAVRALSGMHGGYGCRIRPEYISLFTFQLPQLVCVQQAHGRRALVLHAAPRVSASCWTLRVVQMIAAKAPCRRFGSPHAIALRRAAAGAATGRPAYCEQPSIVPSLLEG